MDKKAREKNLEAFRQLKEFIVHEGNTVHVNDFENFGIDIYKANWVSEIPVVSKCVFCNADWSPDMITLYEAHGYCETCYDVERVLDIFCTPCGKLVYRKEAR